MKKIKNIVLILFASFLCFNAFTEVPNTNQKYRLNKDVVPIFYSYEVDGFGKFKVYVNVKDSIYVLFNIEHEVSLKAYKNIWRVKEGYFCVFDGKIMTPLFRVLTSGENEFVYFSAKPNAGDAVGGFHGNERIDLDTVSHIYFYADNKRINMAQDIPLTPSKSFYYSQSSTMHQVGTGGVTYSPKYIPIKSHPVECYHNKKTTFDNKGYRVDNKVVWTETSFPVKKIYYGIFCVDRIISKNGYKDIPNSTKDIIGFVDDGEFKLNSSHQRIVLYNDSINASVVCDSKVTRGRNFRLNTSILDHKIYHKYYSAIETEMPIKCTQGEVWEMESSIQFNLK